MRRSYLSHHHRGNLTGGELLESRLLLAFAPTPIEQEQLESLNRLRTDPQGELAHLFSDIQNGISDDNEINRALEHFNTDIDLLLEQWEELTPVQPLIWNESLSSAAELQNEAMVQFDIQGHEIANLPRWDVRARQQGYDPLVVANEDVVGENIYAFAENMFHGYAAFAIDWGDGPDSTGGIQNAPNHRTTMMNGFLVEVGMDVRIESDLTTDVGPFLITQDIGRPANWDGPYIVGVVYEDGFANDRYDAGEGFGGVEVEIIDQDGNATVLTTMSAGGYQIQVEPGVYDVRVSGILFPLDMVVSNVVVTNENVKVDFDRSSGLIPPIANPDTFSFLEDVTTLLDVLDNDQQTQSALDPTSVVVTESPQHGATFVNPVTGDISFDPDAEYSGSDSFKYRVRDVNGSLSEEATVSITINGTNDPPVGTDFMTSVAGDGSVERDAALRVTDSDSSINWNTLHVEDQPDSGSVTVDGVNRTITYEPNSGFSGDDTFTYRVADTQGNLSLAHTVTVNVDDANEPPTAADDVFGTVTGNAKSLLVLGNDVDPDGVLSYSDVEIVDGPNFGTIQITANAVVYTPNPSFSGEDSFTYLVRDGVDSPSNTATAKVLVATAGKPWQNPVNPADVDGNGVVTPLDALLVINFIGLVDIDANTVLPGVDDAPPPFIDVNGNGDVTPLDALLVIADFGNVTNSTSNSALSAGFTSIFTPLNSMVTLPSGLPPASTRLNSSSAVLISSLPTDASPRMPTMRPMESTAEKRDAAAPESSAAPSDSPSDSPVTERVLPGRVLPGRVLPDREPSYSWQLRASVFGDGSDSTNFATTGQSRGDLEEFLHVLALDVAAHTDA